MRIQTPGHTICVRGFFIREKIPENCRKCTLISWNPRWALRDPRQPERRRCRQNFVEGIDEEIIDIDDEDCTEFEKWHFSAISSFHPFCLSSCISAASSVLSSEQALSRYIEQLPEPMATSDFSTDARYRWALQWSSQTELPAVCEFHPARKSMCRK